MLKHMPTQQIYGLCTGYEGLNDHARPRRDILMQAVAGHWVLVEQFIAQHGVAPTEVAQVRPESGII